jgi:antitoxin MazE
MRVAKWGESLAIRLPADLVEALRLKEGDDIQIQVVGAGTFEIQRLASPAASLSQLRKFRGRLPEDFTFDRLEAHEHR